MTFELDLFITNKKLERSTNIIDCVVKEINKELSEFFDKRMFEYNYYGGNVIYKNEHMNEHVNEHVNESENEHRNLIIHMNDREYCSENVKQSLDKISGELNKHANETDVTIRCVYVDENVDGEDEGKKKNTFSINSIDHQETAHFTPSLKMSHFRNVLKSSPLSEQYKLFVRTETFYITEEVEELIRSRFGTVEDIYAFQLKFDDISFSGISHESWYDFPSYAKDKYVSHYSVIEWKQIFKLTDEFTLLSTHDDKKDKNIFIPYDFYINENESNKYLVIYNFFKEEAYLLHQRMKDVQTFEYINDGATLELSELMFVHDENNHVRMFKRQDSLNITEDEATCEEMIDNFDIWELQLMVINCKCGIDKEKYTKEELEDADDYGSEFFDSITKLYIEKNKLKKEEGNK